MHDLVVMGLLFAFFRFTRLGVAMKATQQNAMAARINGIRTKRILAFTFGLSSVIGAVAAMLVAPITTLDPTLMWDPLLKGFAAAVLLYGWVSTRMTERSDQDTASSASPQSVK